MRPKWYAHLREVHLVTYSYCPWLYNQTCTSRVWMHPIFSLLWTVFEAPSGTGLTPSADRVLIQHSTAPVVHSRPSVDKRADGARHISATTLLLRHTRYCRIEWRRQRPRQPKEGMDSEGEGS